MLLLSFLAILVEATPWSAQKHKEKNQNSKKYFIISLSTIACYIISWFSQNAETAQNVG